MLRDIIRSRFVKDGALIWRRGLSGWQKVLHRLRPGAFSSNLRHRLLLLQS
jgi:hypothetical protein